MDVIDQLNTPSEPSRKMTMGEQLQVALDRKRRSLLTVQQFAGKYPHETEGSLRWKIFNRTENGLDRAGVLVRIGGRVYLDEDRYFEWVASLNDGGAR